MARERERRPVIAADLFALVGRTPHLCVPVDSHAGVRLYAKLEGYNPTGSVKDRACVTMLRREQERGRLRPGLVLLDASSGNLACSLAFFGRLLGHAVHAVVSSKLTEDKRRFLEYYGATVQSVGHFTIDGNRVCRAMMEEDGGRQYCFLDQLHNWGNPDSHYCSTGPEILEDFPQLAMLVGSLGSGGTLMGAGQFIKERQPTAKVIAVCAALGARIPGTGSFAEGDYVTPFIERGFEDGIFDCAIDVSEAEACAETHAMRDRGIFAGLQCGAVMHGARMAIDEYHIRGDVVVLVGDSGWKNLHRLTL